MVHSLSCVTVAVRSNPRYVGDHIIRHYRPLGLATLLRDLGADPGIQEYEIIGGIGRLVLRADGSETWEPTIREQPASNPPVIQADPETVKARQDTCLACGNWDIKCTIAGCSCNGMGMPERALSKCPMSKW